jgi:hypothetical protein
MRVRIVSPFEVDTASGRVRYVRDQIVPNGQKNWVDKGLAVEEKPDKPAVSEESAG